MVVLALAMLCMAACAAADAPHHHKLHRSKTHISLIQASEGRSSGSLRNGFLGDAHHTADDTDTDDDDDDDDDDDKQKDAAEDKLEDAKEETEAKTLGVEATVLAKKEEAAEAKALATAAKAKAEKKKAAEAKVLATAVEKQDAAQSTLQDFKDDGAFDKKVAIEVGVIANETQSPGLSSFLGALRTEMRAYSKPSYSVYLENKVAFAEGRVAKLEAELKNHKKVEPDGSNVDEAGGKKKKTSVKPGKEDTKEAKAEAVSAATISQKASETWAISFFANVALMSVVFAMASASNTGVKQGTWFLIDQVVAIFLAVLYFQAFSSLMDFADFAPHNHVLVSIIHAVAMLVMVLVVARFVRNQGIVLAVLCGVGAHICCFSSIHAAASVQNMWLGWSYTWVMCIFGLSVLGLGLAIIGYLVYSAKKQANLIDQDDFMDKTDDLENDFGAMAFSVVFTMFVRFVLTGHHPVDDDTEFDHSAQDRSRMFIYACLCLVVAGFVVSLCSKKAEEYKDNYAVKRIMTFFTTVAAMNVAWALLYWGEWEFFEALYPGKGEEIKGRAMFAIVTTCLGCLAMVGLSKVPSSATKGNTASTMKVSLTAISLLIAWSWELCFDTAMEQMSGGAHPAGLKIASTLALFTIVVPVYYYHIKPACIANSPDA